MPEQSYRVYPYRWVILGLFMLVNLTIQLLWICFAPITGPAAKFYGVSDLQIGLLAMLFMIVYIPLSIPISWMIDTLGYSKAVGIGVVILGVFGMLRGMFAANYTWVLIMTIGIAVSQPFLLNSVSTVAAKWFPMKERATAVGLGLVAGFIGIGLGQVTSPILVLNYGITTMQMIYGVINLVAVILFLAFNREAPPTPPCPPGQETRALVLDGLKSMLQMKDIWLLLYLFLIGMGIFNGVSTWIEDIVRPRGFSITEAGNLGGILLLGGILGAIVMPALSDQLRKRKIFLLIGMVLALPGLIGAAFATSYWLLATSMGWMGFFLMSLAPIGYQYAAEITYPAPEGTSNGLLNLAGQISVVFIFAMDALKDSKGNFTLSFFAFIAMMVLGGFFVAALRESTMISQTAEGEPAAATAD